MARLRVTNLTSLPFRGWLRATIDDDASIPSAGTVDLGGTTSRFVAGRRIGNARVIDIHCEVPGGETKVANISAPITRVASPLPGLRSLPTNSPICIGGHAMTMIDAAVDGAAVTAHMRDRVGAFVVNVWLRWYPGEPCVAGEAIVTHSDPRSADLVAMPNRDDFRLTWEGAVASRPDAAGPEVGPLYLVEATPFADGQGKGQPFTFLFTHLLNDQNWQQAMIRASWGISIVGDTQLLPDGQPHVAPGANAWGMPLIGGAFSRLRTWDPPVCGPSIRSADTGRQEDQVFHPGSEALADDGAGCEYVRYLSALKLHSERPCNHCEATGAPLDIATRPGLVFWDGRPHFLTSADKLGKTQELDLSQSHGRWGPDTQHFCFSTLMAAARQSASPALQWLLQQMTSTYLLQRTSTPGRATSATWSAREWGYECLFVLQCDRTLEDRQRAAALVARLRERLPRIVAERNGHDNLYTFFDTPSLGAGPWCIAWQECWGAYGIDLASEKLGYDDGRRLAYRVASRMMRQAWVETPDGWLSRADLPLADQPMPSPNGSFNAFAMCLAPEVIMRSPFSNQGERDRATSILRQVIAAGDLRWLPRAR